MHVNDELLSITFSIDEPEHTTMQSSTYSPSSHSVTPPSDYLTIQHPSSQAPVYCMSVRPSVSPPALPFVRLFVHLMDAALLYVFYVPTLYTFAYFLRNN